MAAGETNHVYLHFTFGSAVRYRRAQLGLTQEELARKVAVSQSLVSKWESLTEAPHDPFVLARLADALELTVEELQQGLVPKPGAQAAGTESDQSAEIALIRRLAGEFGGPDADWRELAAWVEAWRLLPPEGRRRWLELLQFNADLAKRASEQDNAERG